MVFSNEWLRQHSRNGNMLRSTTNFFVKKSACLNFGDNSKCYIPLERKLNVDSENHTLKPILKTYKCQNFDILWKNTLFLQKQSAKSKNILLKCKKKTVFLSQLCPEEDNIVAGHLKSDKNHIQYILRRFLGAFFRIISCDSIFSFFSKKRWIFVREKINFETGPPRDL